MPNADRQTEDAFIAASQELLSGSSMENVVAQQQQHQDDVAPMIGVVKALKDMPPPRLSPEALTRIEQRTQLAAQSRLAGAAQSRHLTLLRPGLDTGRRGMNEGYAPSTLPTRKGIFRAKPMAAVAAVVIVIFATAALTAGMLAWQHGAPGAAQQLESYSGIITKIEAGRWILDDGTEMMVDDLTETHGRPEVGARMICIAERLEGDERYRALEVWILSAPEAPTELPLPSHTFF